MARRKWILRPEDASTEGVRWLRVILQRMSYGQLARKLGLDESTVRHYAREERRPSHQVRWRCFELFGLDGRAWDEPHVEAVSCVVEQSAKAREEEQDLAQAERDLENLRAMVRTTSEPRALALELVDAVAPFRPGLAKAIDRARLNVRVHGIAKAPTSTVHDARKAEDSAAE